MSNLDPEAATPRISQRAPRSCINCARRKVRCTRRIPCTNCIRRGEVSSCAPEVVITTTHKKRPEEPPLYKGLHYDELVTENLFLQSKLAEVSNNATASRTLFRPDFTVHEHIQRLFDGTEDGTQPSPITEEADIRFPSRALSEVLIGFAGYETAWNHFAIHVPTFQEEHRRFWEPSDSDDTQRSSFDPAWLAVYFSLLSAVLCYKGNSAITDAEELHGQEAFRYMNHWYHAAIFFLYKIDFVRVPNIRTVQTIAILGDVFVTVGEPKCLSTLWSVAIQVAKNLGINSEATLSNLDYLNAELSRRLWWQLVICDWMAVPFRTPFIHPLDFNVNLPSLVDDEELLEEHSPKKPADYPRPIHWQLILIRAARSFYTLHNLIRTGIWSEPNATALVFQTDENIANLISELPSWFSPSENDGSTDQWSEAEFPWISTQRARTYLMAYESRINIYSLLLNVTSDTSRALSRAKSIYLASSRTTLHLSLSLSDEVVKSWYNITNIYSAIMGLIRESPREPHNDVFEDDRILVHQGLDILRSFQKESRLAESAVRILSSSISGTEFSGD